MTKCQDQNAKMARVEGKVLMAETSEHLALKELAASVGRKLGWTTRNEVRLPETGKRVDVLLEKGDRRVAVEIQWSSQSHARYLERQVGYAASGVETVWLHRNTRLEPSQTVMEGRVSNVEAEFRIELAGYPGQRLSAGAFIEACLDGSLRYGLSDYDPVNFTVMAAEAECWHPTCKTSYKMIPAVFATLGRYRFVDFQMGAHIVSLMTLGDIPALRSRLLGALNDAGGWSHVRDRYSRTLERSYFSCGCPNCGRIFGDHYAFPYIYDAKPIGVFQSTLAILANSPEPIEDYGGTWVVW